MKNCETISPCVYDTIISDSDSISANQVRFPQKRGSFFFLQALASAPASTTTTAAATARAR